MNCPSMILDYLCKLFFFALLSQMFVSVCRVSLFVCKLSTLIFASGLKFHLLTRISAQLYFFRFYVISCDILKKMVVQAREGD